MSLGRLQLDQEEEEWKELGGSRANLCLQNESTLHQNNSLLQEEVKASIFSLCRPPSDYYPSFLLYMVGSNLRKPSTLNYSSDRRSCQVTLR